MKGRPARFRTGRCYRRTLEWIAQVRVVTVERMDNCFANQVDPSLFHVKQKKKEGEPCSLIFPLRLFE